MVATIALGVGFPTDSERSRSWTQFCLFPLPACVNGSEARLEEPGDEPAGIGTLLWQRRNQRGAAITNNAAGYLSQTTRTARISSEARQCDIDGSRQV